MGVLHLVNRSPYASHALAQCLARAGAGDALLLLEGGVYAALKDGAFAPILYDALGRLSVHVLAPDLSARGILEEDVLEGVKRVDYQGFVELSVAHCPIQSWF